MKVTMNIKNIKKFSLKKRLIFFALLLVLIKVTFSVYAHFFQEPNPEVDVNIDQLELEVVHKGDLFETIDVLGKTKLIDEQKLRFNLTGKVTKVNFADGDFLKSGDIIAELDKSDVENEIKQAEIALENAEMDFKKLTENGGSSLEIKRAESALESSKVNLELEKQSLDLAQKKLDEDISKLEQNLARLEDDLLTKTTDFQNAKKKLNNLGVFYANKKENIVPYFFAQESNLGINSLLLFLEDSVDSLDYLFDEDLNNEYRNYLGVLDSNTVNFANISYKKTINEVDEIKEEFDNLYSQDLTLEELGLFFTDLKAVFRLLSDASSDAYAVLENSETGASFSQSQLDSLKSTFSGLRSSAESKVTEVESLSEKVDSELESLRLAKNSSERANEDFEELKQATPRLKNDVKIAYEKLKNQYKDMIEKIPKSEQSLEDLKRSKEEAIKRAKNEIDLQKLLLEKTRKNVSKYELTAPFDGLLRKIDFKVGDNLVNEESKYAYLENPNILKITINLDQVDAVKVKNGQSAKIVFDALPEKEFTGKIEEINQSPQEESSIVSYEATLTLEKGEERIFSGMTAKVTIFVNEKKDVLLIPILALQGESVQKMVNGELVNVVIEKGLDNGVDVEVISGLEEGDQIVVLDYAALDESMEIHF